MDNGEGIDDDLDRDLDTLDVPSNSAASVLSTSMASALWRDPSPSVAPQGRLAGTPTSHRSFAWEDQGKTETVGSRLPARRPEGSCNSGREAAVDRAAGHLGGLGPGAGRRCFPRV